MFYYLVAILKQNSPILTYTSKIKLQIGEIIKVPLHKSIKTAVVLQSCKKPNFECKEIQQENSYFSKTQINLAEFITSYYCTSRAIAYGIFTPFLQDSNTTKPSNLEFNLPQLNTKQTEAYNFIMERQSSLLFGDTGSGKTEIYIHLLNQTLKQSQNALFLMPEISLTPQMEKRLYSVFGDILAFWHSKLSPKKRKETLQRIHNGEIRILAGARSALFLPIHHLGLIIIDEEHDDAYKSNSAPRYHARDVALYLAKQLHTKIVLGSATPLASTYYKFQQNQSVFRLKGTYYQSQKEFLFCHSTNENHPFILESLANNLQNHKQAIVFLPTRANFKHLLCQTCGESIQCPNCSVSMSLHTKDSSLKCHYCHYTSPIPQSCPLCGGQLNSLRIGTQEFANNLTKEFPKANIACFDRDSITTQNKLEKTLESFNNNQIDILVGTQMLSKGHDYHNVSLSVALGLDYILKSSDYRARERALSLMFQLSGRSGRKEHGKVLIQTLQDDFFKAYLKDYELFLKDELHSRKHLYPPFMRLALIKISHKQQEKALQITQEILKILPKNEKIEIVGYGLAPIEKIANKWRYVILLRSLEAKTLHQTLLPIKDYPCEIDIDPIEFY